MWESVVKVNRFRASKQTDDHIGEEGHVSVMTGKEMASAVNHLSIQIKPVNINIMMLFYLGCLVGTIIKIWRLTVILLICLSCVTENCCTCLHFKHGKLTTLFLLL